MKEPPRWLIPPGRLCAVYDRVRRPGMAPGRGPGRHRSGRGSSPQAHSTHGRCSRPTTPGAGRPR
nr:MAG TPA: hypothetical protein [Caudoviricetes sp.]